MVLPYAVCLPVWLLSYRVDTCHRTGQLLCPRRRRTLSNMATARVERGAWKTVSICKLVVVVAAYKRLGVVSADGLSFQARTERNLSLRGICTEFEFDKVQNPLHFED